MAPRTITLEDGTVEALDQIYCEDCGVVSRFTGEGNPDGWVECSFLEPESGLHSIYICPFCYEAEADRMDAMRWANGW